jgi:hypothetical protein
MASLTAEQCRDTAFRKMIEAKSHGSERRPELVKTAEAWQALAEQLDIAEALGTFATRDSSKSSTADGGASMYFRATTTR